MKKQALITCALAGTFAAFSVVASPLVSTHARNTLSLFRSSMYYEPGFTCQEDMRREPAGSVSCWGSSGVKSLHFIVSYQCTGGVFTVPGIGEGICDGTFQYFPGETIPIDSAISNGDSPFTALFDKHVSRGELNLPPGIHFLAIGLQINGCKMKLHLKEDAEGNYTVQEEMGKIYNCEGPDATEFTEIPIKTA